MAPITSKPTILIKVACFCNMVWRSVGKSINCHIVVAKSDVRPRKLDIFTLKRGVSDFWWPMLIFEITKTNTPLPQKGLAPILIAPPHTYVRKSCNDSSVKQSKTNVTHRSRRNKATSASDRTPSLSLSSLQHWKDDPIITRVLHLAFAVYQCIQTLAGAAQRNTTTVASGVDTVYKPSFFPLLFFLSAISIFLSSLGSANVCHVH